MTVTGPNNPTTRVTIVAGWSNPTNAFTSNNKYATTTTNNAEEEYSGYGFTIGSDQQIEKVEIGFEGNQTSSEGVIIYVSDGITVEFLGQPNLTSSDTLTYFASVTISWTPAKVNNDLRGRMRANIGAGCLVQGSMVLTPSGPVSVEKLSVGDEVLDDWGPVKITAKTLHFRKDDYQHKFNGVGFLGKHLVWNKSDWVDVRTLQRIVIPYSGYVFNIETESGMYLVRGKKDFIVHNLTKQ